jgi:hypothetical protein
MEGNGRRLAWIAIALSALALVVSVSGRASSHWQGAYGMQQRGYAPPAMMQPGQNSPQGNFGPQGNVGPQGNFEQRRQGKFEQRFRGDFRQPGPIGRQGGGPGWFFLMPFMLLGKLFKLVFVVLLIWLGLRLLSGRGFGGRWGRGPGGSGPSARGPEDRPASDDPEQPPYTGDTRQI